MLTIAEAISRHGVQVDEHLDRQATIPVSDGLQRQGDIIVVPAHIAEVGPTRAGKVGPQGHPVVRGEAGGNTHLLLADGDVYYSETVYGQVLGVLTVADGATAWLAHPEHGYAGIAPGTYQLRRQREQADEIRLVAD
jgi:hypothetical protein